jgi:hypothetical protein
MADKNLLKQSTQVLQENWEQLSKKDIAKSKGSIEELVKTIVEKTGDATETVTEKVNGIIEDVRGRRRKKTFLGRVRGFTVGVIKFTAAMAAIAAAAAIGMMFWRKRMEQSSAGGYASSAEPLTMDQAAAMHSAESVTTPPAAARGDNV